MSSSEKEAPSRNQIGPCGMATERPWEEEGVAMPTSLSHQVPKAQAGGLVGPRQGATDVSRTNSESPNHRSHKAPRHRPVQEWRDLGRCALDEKTIFASNNQQQIFTF